ncbi:Outer membrane efflux protein [Rubripirellula lacrimiformis]|uniref:Outer membrane efflux protein n=1 Tax=Rubripirellula lacrimiformis TaxID=1930273 RepID=A0A517NE73_9BACT|nr:TolC family protein [Rubripirellula lacrimiformis]QDT05424.1 Outer membrane efflux protein [Rubripirellula lacrimiformis]
MDTSSDRNVLRYCLITLVFAAPLISRAEEPCQPILPEQRCLDVRSPGQMCQVAVPLTRRPATVNDPQFDAPVRHLTLNDAINIALANSEVVRVLGGVTASTSGRTIYDTAIINTTIDQQRAAFDPNLQLNNSWNQTETPTAAFDPLDPTNAIINGTQNEGYGLDFGLSKRNLLGGTTNLGVNSNRSRITPGFLPLNPADRTATDLSYTQPILAGAGKAANQVPIVLARIETERSYFQYKAAVQQSVQGVIEAYWSLVFAKTDLWARNQQVEQATFANNRTIARVAAGDASSGDLAQTQLALENFRASLLASQANVLQRQAALLNILGLPPYEAQRTVPVTPMTEDLIAVDWASINELAQRERPDIIELKLILEADQQRFLLADNQARPQLNGVALYRWNGLEGIAPAGNRVRSGSGDFEDWSLGINFSIPLGLRAERASLRQRRLIIQRDRANLDQGLHNMQHLLALSLRNLEQFYAQYERFQAVRVAARKNLEQQLAQYDEGIVQFIVVLQAIVDWGNSVSAEAQSLSQYNTELARLELQTGTILQEHNIVFFEERFRSIGPIGRLGSEECYPRSQRPSANVDRYKGGSQPSEDFFDLEDPVNRKSASESDQSSPVEVDMDTDVEFQKIDANQDGEMTDEEIDKMLEKKNAMRTFSDFLKSRLRR